MYVGECSREPVFTSTSEGLNLDKDELKQVLKQLKSQSDIASVRQRAEKLLNNVDPRVLSLAEQELLREGFSQDDLRSLCDIHLQLLSGKIEGKPETDLSHPISILQEEHKAISGYLDKLEEIAKKLNTDTNLRLSQDQLTELRTVSQMLLEAESHHKREEDALFPRLEQQGINGPPSIMRLEHNELRKRKKALKELIERADRLEATNFSQELNELTGYIVPTLRSHIFKEDNILYPTALQAIRGDEWSSIRRQFDEIGYCPFTRGIL